jgi:hypothetical protein
MTTVDDLKISGMTMGKVEQAVQDIAEYLEKVTGEACVFTTEISPSDIWFYVEQHNRKASIQITQNDKQEAVNMMGIMQSSLCTPSAATHPVALLTLADLLDFMIVHLCPIVCIPRAIYYIAFTLKIIQPAESVDSQILIDEQDGEFIIKNLKANMACRFRIVNNEIVYNTPSKEKRIPEPFYDEENGVIEQGYDYVQHAFCRQADIKYLQHPHIGKAVHRLLKQIGLAGMETQLREQAIQLMQSSPPKGFVMKKRGGEVAG